MTTTVLDVSSFLFQEGETQIMVCQRAALDWRIGLGEKREVSPWNLGKAQWALRDSVL